MPGGRGPAGLPAPRLAPLKQHGSSASSPNDCTAKLLRGSEKWWPKGTARVAGLVRAWRCFCYSSWAPFFSKKMSAAVSGNGGTEESVLQAAGRISARCLGGKPAGGEGGAVGFTPPQACVEEDCSLARCTATGPCASRTSAERRSEDTQQAA